ncbi:3D domain-containing protein [Paenibacillus beijingensis]|uniref:G5 domain-containing protein n=1 Tax=Paenibacillus beijingensis TaxID=1126833 RepID=A0A0D5NHQ1_9BACL|nr:3D domain-containing protein [Paenibacillus beijingensis]AJY74914.1 hypothetical protein VN24_10335 [Paenibacillus beijingensis]
MGAIPLKDTHVKRSSSMSFARRWKHENLRLILLSGIISIAMIFMLLVLLYGSSEKHVSVVLNGQETVVSTKQGVLQRLLDEQAITVGPHDKVSVPLDSKISDGDKIIIELAIPITVKADGKTSTVYTTEKTVESAIGELNITLRDLDKITPSLGTVLKPNTTVKVVRVDKKISHTEHEIPFKVVKTTDATMEKGKSKMITAGKNGHIVKSFEHIFEDGVLVSTTLVTKVVEKSVVNKVVAVGTKKKPQVSVLSASPEFGSITAKGFKARKTLNNVTLTAYTAGVASTGKSASHPQYGITASGAKVKEGRTIAVDPDVIPLGWWVYIEGIGFRRAEDTGSAINGNKIDVYYESESYANKFGKKRGYTVYVLGPTKPSSS